MESWTPVMDPSMKATDLLPTDDILSFFKHSAIAALVCLILRKALVFFLKKIFHILFRDSKEWDQMNIKKSAEELVKVAFFSYTFYCGLMLMISNGVFEDGYDLFELGSITDAQHYNYIVYHSWYFHKLLLDPFEYHRNDWWQMNLHHLITSAVIFMSYAFNFHNVGVLVMFLHDPADITLALAKFFRGLGFGASGTFFFACTIFVWFYTRIWALVKHAIYPAFFPGPEGHLGMETSNIIYGRHTGATVSRVLILSLFSLHCNWQWLLIKVAYRRLFQGKRVYDYRSGHDKND